MSLKERTTYFQPDFISVENSMLWNFPFVVGATRTLDLYKRERITSGRRLRSYDKIERGAAYEWGPILRDMGDAGGKPPFFTLFVKRENCGC